MLAADVSVSCESDEHEMIKGIALLAVFLYPVGVLVATGVGAAPDQAGYVEAGEEGGALMR